MKYKELAVELDSLIRGVPYLTANLANASALLWMNMDRLNWLGFYTVENGRLVLGPFQGKPACIEIPFGKGVCGTAAQENRTVVVPDVHSFPGHIACDGASNSEIVIPIRANGKVFGVLDIDSPEFNRFSEEDRIGLEYVVSVLESTLFS